MRKKNSCCRKVEKMCGDLHESIFPLYFICKILGVAPYSVEGICNRRVYSIKIWDKILMVIHILFVSCVVSWNLKHIFSFRMSITYMVTFVIISTIPFCINMCNTISYYFRQIDFFDVLIRLNEIKSKLQWESNETNRKTRTTVNIFLCTLFSFYIILLVFCSIATYIVVEYYIYQMLILFTFTFYELTIDSLIILLCCELHIQFSELTKCIKNIQNGKYLVKRKIKKLQFYMGLYSDLCEISRKINVLFSPQLVMKIACRFYSFSITLLLAFMANKRENFHSTIPGIVYFSFFIFEIFFIASIFHTLKNKVSVLIQKM